MPPIPLARGKAMAKIDVNQIDKNRRIVAQNTVESPYNAVFADADADFIERLYEQLPPDHIGILPPGTKE